MDTVSISDLQSEITHLRNKVDSFTEENQEAKKAWFKSIPTVISVAAFLFSFGTTIVSYKRTVDQDIHNLKSELRVLLQRLAALPKENLEIYKKYQAEPNLVSSLSGYINQENLLLSKQAGEVIKRLPKDQVSSTDYTAVAMALGQSRNFDAAIANFNSALAAATILDDEITALRALGSLEMKSGKAGDARAHFQRALDIFGEKYRTYDDFTQSYTNFLTEMTWAQAEAGHHNPEASVQHLVSAEQLIGRMPTAPQTDLYRSQAAQFRAVLSAPPQAGAALGSLAGPGGVPALLPDTGLPKPPLIPQPPH
jgi:tetratricopeptide (TPR) repeat protein